MKRFLNCRHHLVMKVLSSDIFHCSVGGGRNSIYNPLWIFLGWNSNCVSGCLTVFCHGFVQHILFKLI